jgi:hypothetical protein
VTNDTAPGILKNSMVPLSILYLLLIYFTFSVKLSKVNNIKFRSPDGLEFHINELINLPAYEIHNLIKIYSSEDMKGKIFADLVAKPNKTPEDYYSILVFMNTAFDSRENFTFQTKDLAAFITHENDTLGPLFLKLCSHNNYFYETGKKINFNFQNQYLEYLLPSNLLEDILGEDLSFIDTYILTFKINISSFSIQHEGKTFNLFFKGMTHSIEQSLLLDYREILKKFMKSNILLNGVKRSLKKCFITITEVFDLFLEDIKVFTPGTIPGETLDTLMENIQNRLRAGTPVLIRSIIMSGNINHVIGILIIKDRLFRFNRARGSGPAKLYFIKPELLTKQGLLDLHVNYSIDKINQVIDSITDLNRAPVYIRVVGLQSGPSCSNEYIKDLLWCLFNIYDVDSYYPEFTKYFRIFQWERMVERYQKYKRFKSNRHSILSLIEFFLGSGFLQMNLENKEYRLPFKLSDKLLLKCYKSFFYYHIKSSEFSFPRFDLKSPIVNLDTLEIEGTVEELVNKKIEKWKSIKTNAENILNQFVSLERHNPILRLLGDIFRNQGKNSIAITKTFSDDDYKLLRELSNKHSGYGILDALSLSMSREPDSLITAENFIFLWELQHGINWKESIFCNENIYLKLNFSLSGEPTAKSLLYGLLWLQNSVEFNNNLLYFINAFLYLRQRITLEMIEEIPELGHALWVSKDFDIHRSRNFIFPICRRIFQSLNQYWLEVFHLHELKYPVEVEYDLLKFESDNHLIKLNKKL